MSLNHAEGRNDHGREPATHPHRSQPLAVCRALHRRRHLHLCRSLDGHGRTGGSGGAHGGVYRPLGFAMDDGELCRCRRLHRLRHLASAWPVVGPRRPRHRLGHAPDGHSPRPGVRRRHRQPVRHRMALYSRHQDRRLCGALAPARPGGTPAGATDRQVAGRAAARQRASGGIVGTSTPGAAPRRQGSRAGHRPAVRRDAGGQSRARRRHAVRNRRPGATACRCRRKT